MDIKRACPSPEACSAAPWDVTYSWVLQGFDDEVTVYPSERGRRADCNELSSQHEGQHSKRRTESPGAGCLLVDVGDGLACMLANEATKRAQETGQRVRPASSDDGGNSPTTNGGATTGSGL